MDIDAMLPILGCFIRMLAMVVAINLLTWFIIGRDQILLKTIPFFDHSCPVLQLDTLHVYAGYVLDNESPERSTVGAFSKQTRHTLLDSLAKRSQSIIEDHNTTTNLFPNSPEKVHFGVWIDRRYPFYAHVIAGEAALGFGATYSQHWVWAFGWHPVGRAHGGCS